MFGTSVPAAAVELEYGSTGHPIDACNPALTVMAALGVMDVSATLSTLVLEPTSGDFARILFRVECFLVGRL